MSEIETRLFQWAIVSGVGLTLWHVAGWGTWVAWMASWIVYAITGVILARRPAKDGR